MKTKNVVTAALLLFVAASLVVLAVKGVRRSPSAVASQTAGESGTEAGEPAITDGIIAYYFHATIRCPTCESIEAYAHEAIESGFAEPLEAGRLQWQVVNYESPENEHFATEYELIAPTVVLVAMDAGNQKQWKNLTKVWELVGDKEAFVRYVQEETRTLLQGTNT